MGQVIEAGARINGKYSASRGFGHWAALEENERARKMLQEELVYKQRYIEFLEGRNRCLTEENERLAALQKQHLHSRMQAFQRPRGRQKASENGLVMAILLGTGAVLGVMLAVAAVVLA